MNDRIHELQRELEKDPHLPISGGQFARFIDILFNNHLLHMDAKITKSQVKIDRTEWRQKFLIVIIGGMAAAVIGILGVVISMAIWMVN